MKQPFNVIGEGSYGCVVKPSLLCSDKKLSYKNKISKLMLTKEALNELKEYTIISKIDKNHKYYLGVPTKCKLKKTKEALKTIKKCKNLTKKLKNANGKEPVSISNLSLLIQNDGGTDLKIFANKLDKLEPSPTNKQYVEDFWKEVPRLYDGLALFAKYGILHHDIKPQNIVYDPLKKRLNFIDFGHMRNIEIEKEKCRQSKNWIYEYAFWNYPFEIQFLNYNDYMKFASKTKEEKEIYYNEFIDALEKYGTYGKHPTRMNDDTENENILKFVEAFSIYMNYILYETMSEDEKYKIVKKHLSDWKKTLFEMKPENYEEFLDKTLKNIDNYGLQMTLTYVHNRSGGNL